jgi:hypothetical protein
MGIFMGQGPGGTGANYGGADSQVDMLFSYPSGSSWGMPRLSLSLFPFLVFVFLFKAVF